MNLKKLKRPNGFTLIELMIVLVILGTLMTILFVSLSNSGVDEQKAKVQMKAGRAQLELALFRFKEYYGRLPSNDEGLKVLVEASSTTENYPSRPFLPKKDMIIDPFGKEYKYRLSEDGAGFDIISLGTDGQEGGEGPAKDIKLADIK